MAGFRQQDPCLLGQYHRQNEGIDNDRKSRGHSTREHQCPLLHRKGLVRNRQGVIDDSFLSWIFLCADAQRPLLGRQAPISIKMRKFDFLFL